jgi:hypothetical protein
MSPLQWVETGPTEKAGLQRSFFESGLPSAAAAASLALTKPDNPCSLTAGAEPPDEFLTGISAAIL